MSVPRCFKPPEFGVVVNVQLHHFSVEFEYGYGAVLYLRIVNDKGVQHCSLVLGKSRVTPLKSGVHTKSGAAAVVTVKFNCLVRNELEYLIHDTIYWTDSTVVLQYIRNKSRRFHTIVVNRVAMIHNESTPHQWRHVDTCANPANIASRGVKGSELHSPKFLWKEEENWSKQLFQMPELPQDDSECKKCPGHANVINKCVECDHLW